MTREEIKEKHLRDALKNSDEWLSEKFNQDKK